MRLLPLFVLLVTAACVEPTEPELEPPSDTTSVVARGARLLGISISDRADGDFNTAYAEAVAVGMQTTGLSLSWDDLEGAPGVYAPNPDFLTIAVDYYDSRGTQVLLELNPIDTNNERVPSYLDGRAWDDPELIVAFKDLLDWAIPRTVGMDIPALAIGNEIDAWLTSDAEWAAYTRFFEEVSAHARSLRPGLRVGSKVTYGGMSGSNAQKTLALNEHTDVVLTTYYPLGNGFQILPPTTVGGVFDDLASRYSGRPLMFAEIGAPSTERCGSSHSQQAAFITEAFAAWDRHAEQVELLEFVWMHDISESALDTYESYYGLSDPCFLEYLATLGLKSHDGTEKPAWRALMDEATARGW